MNTPHKHTALIKAWADGAIIQRYYPSKLEWITLTCAPQWQTDSEYRIKPAEEKKRIKMWQALCKHPKLPIYFCSSYCFQNKEEAVIHYAVGDTVVIRLLPHTEIEVECDC